MLKFRFLLIFFLFLIFVNAHGEEIIHQEVSLDCFISKFNDFNQNLNSKNLENNFNFLEDLKILKEDLVLHKIKLEEFENLFLNMCRLFKNKDISKEEKLVELLKITQDLNNLFNAINLDCFLDEDLKVKIYLLNDLIKLFINNNEINHLESEKHLTSISQGIDIIDNILNTNELEYAENVLPEVDLNQRDLSFNAIGITGIEENDLNINNQDKVVANNINIIEKDLDLGNQKDLFLKKRNTRKIKRNIDINLNDLKNVGRSTVNLLKGIGDYRFGGYPIQFIHQLVQHMDKVYNR